ncbi:MULTISPECIES: hypothetical protein [Ferrimonas]|uniref:hypothetical protein n=1 Tax=Ferrimonas TaxID=44011 RepID=UPI0003F678D9|nr:MULTISPECIES: hypothetical protein [Ferrimonas]USD38335.1 hypothetical protein J8Z22_04085 [Ferrimonas sp. SCSIO 43195]
MKHPQMLALAGILALSAPAQAGWDELKAKAKELGEQAADVSKEAWETTADASKEAWDATSEWSSDTWDASSEWADGALDHAGEWSDDALEKGKVWAKQGEAKLEQMLEPDSPQQARDALNTMSEVTLVRLFSEHPEVKPLFDEAYGYAVFDSRKFSLMLHTNGGSGVAVNRHSHKRTYMNMFGAGLALGLGGKFYQQVMLFEDQTHFDKFVHDGWEASSEAGLVAWDESAEVSAKYNGGMAIFVLNDKGILLDANVTGSRYWQDSDLN